MKKGIDFSESYAFVIGTDSERIMSAIAIFYRYHTIVLDFKNFFLQGTPREDEITYVEQAPGYAAKGKETWVCKLQKTLYGLPTSPLRAQERLIEVLVKKAGFTQLSSEPMVFHRHQGSKFINAGFHVDDGKFITNDKFFFDEVQTILNNEGLKGAPVEKPSKFLGIQYDYHLNSIHLHQEANILQFIQSMQLADAKPSFTPMEEKEGRDEVLNDDDDPLVDLPTYQSLAGQAIWLLRTRYDCMYTIMSICRDMSKPRQSSFQRCKRLGRYLRGSSQQGLTFHAHTDNSTLNTYAYVDASLYVKSVSGIAVFLGKPNFTHHTNTNAAIICFSKKESLAVSSTMDAELLALERGTVACEWVTQFRQELGFPQESPSTIFTDSQTAIRFLEGTGANPNRQTRHLRRRVHFIREAISKNKIQLKFVPSEFNCADVLTKPLGKVLHHRHINNLMGRPRREYSAGNSPI